MTVMVRSGARPLSRTRALSVTAVAAVLLHGGILFSMHWEMPPSVATPAAQEQGVTIDLAPAPARKSEQAAVTKAGEPHPSPPAQHRAEATSAAESIPVPVRKSVQEKTTSRKQSASRKTAATAHAAKTKKNVDMPVPVSSSTTGAGSSPKAASSPAPVDTHTNPRPIYPELARKRGQEGLVRLLAQVDSNGTLIELAVAQSSGYSLLDEAALKAVRRWRFRPGLNNGQAVNGSVIIPVEFRLQQHPK